MDCVLFIRLTGEGGTSLRVARKECYRAGARPRPPCGAKVSGSRTSAMAGCRKPRSGHAHAQEHQQVHLQFRGIFLKILAWIGIRAGHESLFSPVTCLRSRRQAESRSRYPTPSLSVVDAGSDKSRSARHSMADAARHDKAIIRGQLATSAVVNNRAADSKRSGCASPMEPAGPTPPSIPIPASVGRAWRRPNGRADRRSRPRVDRSVEEWLGTAALETLFQEVPRPHLRISA